MNRREFLISSASAAAALSLFSAEAFAQQLNIAIATGGTGGVYYPLGGGMANVLTKYVPGAAATARVRWSACTAWRRATNMKDAGTPSASTRT